MKEKNMSHFSALVRVPGNFNIKQVPEEVNKILEPYGENSEEYFEFVDCTKEVFSYYESEKIPVIEYKGKYIPTFDYKLKDIVFEKLKDLILSSKDIIKIGDKIVSIDDRIKLIESTYSFYFYVKDFYQKYGFNNILKLLGFDEKEISMQEMYGNIDKCSKEYHGYIKQDDKYGYKRNPNGKWDWYSIGGRWAKFLPVNENIFIDKNESYFNRKESKRNEEELIRFGEKIDNLFYVDIVRIKNIDFEKASEKTKEKLDKFIIEYKELIDGKKFEIFKGPRSFALDVGLLEVKNDNELTDVDRDNYFIIPYDNNRNDVLKPIDNIDRKDLENYFNSIRTYSFITEKDWIEAGSMGWFGVSHSTPNSKIEYSNNFMNILKSGDDNDWVVCVDLHT